MKSNEKGSGPFSTPDPFSSPRISRLKKNEQE
jgi:hypothetical protein